MIGIHFFGACPVLFLVKTPFSIVREETCEELRILSLEEGMQQYEVLFDFNCCGCCDFNDVENYQGYRMCFPVGS